MAKANQQAAAAATADTEAPAAQVDSVTQPLPASAQPVAPAAPVLPVIPVAPRPTVAPLAPGGTTVQATSAEESVRMSRGTKPQTSVDAGAIKGLSDQLRQQFIDAVADLTGTAREALATAADTFVPLIAEQSLLQAQATTPEASSLAARNKRHLEGRLLMQAGQYGIALQQRSETRLLGIVDGLISRGAALV